MSRIMCRRSSRPGCSPATTLAPSWLLLSSSLLLLVAAVAVVSQLSPAGVDACVVHSVNEPSASRRKLSALMVSNELENALRAELGGSGSISSEVSEAFATRAAAEGWEAFSNSASSALDDIISAIRDDEETTGTAPSTDPTALPATSAPVGPLTEAPTDVPTEAPASTTPPTASTCSSDGAHFGDYYVGLPGFSCSMLCAAYGGTCDRGPMSNICDIESFAEAARGATGVIDGSIRDFSHFRTAKIEDFVQAGDSSTVDDPSAPGITWEAEGGPAYEVNVPSSSSVPDCDASFNSIRLCSCDVTEESKVCPGDYKPSAQVTYHLGDKTGETCDEVCEQQGLTCDAEPMGNICNRFAFQEVATLEVLQSYFDGDGEAQIVIDAMASGLYPIVRVDDDDFTPPLIGFIEEDNLAIIALSDTGSSACDLNPGDIAVRLCSCRSQ